MRNYKFRIYPNKKQTKLLERILELHRQLYNDALDERRYLWRSRKASVSYYSQSSQIKGIRSDDPALMLLNFTSIQRTLRRLDKAFAAFFRRVKRGETPGYPRFKGRNRWHSVVYVFGDGIGWAKNGRLHVQNVGNIRIFQHRNLPEGNTKTVRLLRKRDKWYVIFTVDTEAQPVPEHTGTAIGIDLGVTTVVALSNGELVKAPQYLRQSAARLRRQQRRMSRRKKGSSGWRKAAAQIAKTHEHIANQRRDFNHKLSRRLANEFSLIAVEDLNILGLSRSRLAKSVNDASWGQLLSFLAYKVEETGSEIVSVDPRYTSQVCSNCGSIVKKTLSVRVHKCPDCGFVADRDINAAINILNRALPARTERRGVNVVGCDARSPESPRL